MVNSLLNAVTTRLGTVFGTGYRYYVENVEQNLKKPCFTVDMLSPVQRSRSPRLYDRTMPLVVHYFSNSEQNIKQDCYNMAERALECLEYLPYGNTMLRGEDISWQIVDGVLQIFITYKFRTVMSEETEDNMTEVLNTIAQVK
jgi:hypothetical protein